MHTTSKVIEEAKKLSDEDPEFALIWDALVKKNRIRTELAVAVVVNETSLGELGSEIAKRKTVVRWMKRMEEIGAGKFVPGRGSKQSRFRWSVPPKEVVRGVAGDDSSGKSAAEFLSDDDLDRAIRHEFRLRPDFLVELTLPTSFSPAEAVRLATFVQSLPFITETRSGQ